MKKITIGFLIAILICAGGFGLYSLYGEDIFQITDNGSEVNHEDQSVITPHLIDIEEEYYDSVNADITLEQLQNSKVVRDIQILNEGSPVAQASIFIFKAEIISKSGQVLTLSKEEDLLSLYIGKYVEVELLSDERPNKTLTFAEVKIGDIVNIHAEMQTSTNSPLRISSPIFIFQED